MSNVFKFSAEMTCSSCSNCMTKALERSKAKGVGISSYEVDLAGKQVTVIGTISEGEITEVLNKTGIKIALLEVVPKAAE